jgi:hypothetical protein
MYTCTIVVGAVEDMGRGMEKNDYNGVVVRETPSGQRL